MLIPLLAACPGEHVEPEQAPAQETARPATTAQAQPPQKTTIVRGADGSEHLTLTQADGVLEISFTEGGTKRTLRGEPRDTGKRKYQVDGGPVQFEIKQIGRASCRERV